MTVLEVRNCPRGSIYTTIMELGPQNHTRDGFLGPNSIVVVYMDPLGILRTAKGAFFGFVICPPVEIGFPETAGGHRYGTFRDESHVVGFKVRDLGSGV